jgi:hypothetical protein
LVVGDGALPIWVIDTDDGSITGYDDLEPEVAMTEEVRPAGTSEAAGIEFTRVPGGESGYAVLTVGRLEIAPNGWLIGTGTAPLVILALITPRLDTEMRTTGSVATQ